MERPAEQAFVAGQTVIVMPIAGTRFTVKPGRYRIVRPLPFELDDEPRYLVECLADQHRRVVSQACLADPAPEPRVPEAARPVKPAQPPKPVQSPKPEARQKPRAAAATMAKSQMTAKPKAAKRKATNTRARRPKTRRARGA